MVILFAIIIYGDYVKNMLSKLKLHIKNNYKGIIIDLLVISFFLFASLYNFPYLVYKPGGTIPLESRMYIDDKNVELGDYNLAYVSVARGNLLNLIFVACSNIACGSQGQIQSLYEQGLIWKAIDITYYYISQNIFNLV